ncbi:MAG TPA: preprotein translocase subunit SecE [Thermoanaerobacterales bacterium]|jgi:preprotein translocase subunit SecE|nr:preprotein translocase subunit SecE [Thermoanaerobacterales bacterium]
MAAANEGFVKRTGKFFKEVRSELKKVTWPTKNELITYTIVVIISVVIVSAIIGITDAILYKIISLILQRGI